jgi:hypothetical protein
MKVEITVKVDGELVKKHLEEVEGTLEQMEEKIDALSRTVANETLQASVDAMPEPRPLFRQRADGFAIRDTNPERSLGSTDRLPSPGHATNAARRATWSRRSTAFWISRPAT